MHSVQPVRRWWEEPLPIYGNQSSALLIELRYREIDAELLLMMLLDAAFPCRYLRYLPLVGLRSAPLQGAG